MTKKNKIGIYLICTFAVYSVFLLGTLALSKYVKFDYYASHKYSSMLGGVVACLFLAIVICIFIRTKPEIAFKGILLPLAFMLSPVMTFPDSFSSVMPSYLLFSQNSVIDGLSQAIKLGLFLLTAFEFFPEARLKKIKPKNYIPVLSLVVVAMIFFAFSPKRIAVFGGIPILLATGFLFYLGFLPKQERKEGRVFSYAISMCYYGNLSIFSVLLILESMQFCGIIGGLYYNVILYGISFILWLLAYVKNIKNVIVQSEITWKMEKEINALQSAALAAQIKSHFLFNTLVGIQNIFINNPSVGGLAVEKLRDYLNKYSEETTYGTVSFLKEVDYIENYLELEKLCFNRNIEFKKDLKYVDFSIPPLSLQPFVENSIRHGCLKDNGGQILIESEYCEGKIIIRVSDNGIGFDKSKIRDGAVGLKNAIERMELLMNAKMEIISEAGKGTTILAVFQENLNRGEK